ncbi:wall-associated receptor kinase 3-like [Arachis duranensis]|uniref:Wall-associated receptor kinase 3-like n=1 Tax=Arachis duranensis TaxID=130453 RepID=A0A6P4BS41_ARADU|nr:wall-associated receptor kinase 3-like [Arachis duranensis]
MAEHLSKNLLFLIFFIAAHANDAATQPAKHCLTKCGHVSIPFPFGTTTDCSLDTNFLINCTNNVPYLLPLSNDTALILLSISLVDSDLRVSSPVASDCYSIDDQGKISNIQTDQFLFSGNFSISWTRNTFTAIGCNTLGVVVAFTLEDPRRYPATCFSYCEKLEHASNGSCTGSGCCHTSIPRAAEGRLLTLIGYYFENNDFNNSQVRDFNPCSYAFLVEEGGYEFQTTHLKKLESTEFPVVLDWSIGDQTCIEAMKNPSSFACKAENSTCHDSDKRPGYVCKCPSGFQGNPYLLHGCQQDIDECAGPNDCFHEAKCENTPGSYNCLCPEGFEGDGKNNGTRCNSPKSSYRTNNTLIYSLCLGISIGILALVVASFYVHWKVNKRKLIKLKEQYFQQNGGFLLQEHISKHRNSSQIAKVFTIEELRKATNNFDACKILGQGGQGTVYKGVLSDNKTVAIKKSKISSPSQINKDFINELVVLSQINHRNVVKLLGCCLETEIPLLVYEFIPNGTVFEHLHGHGTFLRLTWKTRLRIAAETAGALAYLHLDTCIPIIHRDVKTSNILLDHDLTAKVSDFGASRIVPQDKIELATLVQGTCGYLDPETFLTSQLTDKSDVYSFGVVLAELFTGRKALSFDMPDAEKNLAMFFVTSMEENRLLDIVDKSIINEAKVEHVYEFAKIAKQCLSSKGEERPTMKVVAMELEGLRAEEKHIWCREKEEFPSEETEILLKASPSISNNLEEEYFMLLDRI